MSALDLSQTKRRHRDFVVNSKSRRVLQAILYEVFAIASVVPMLNVIFDNSPASTIGLAFVLSIIALGWNYVFNTIFDCFHMGLRLRLWPSSVRGEAW